VTNRVASSQDGKQNGVGLSFTSLLMLFVFASTLKTLLFPAYYSTDFDVHRNWLAITHSLPLHQWYTEATSEWTLDYPPFFAYFEYLLAWPARFADPQMLVITAGPYASLATTLYQRGTVIICDLVLLGALERFFRGVVGGGWMVILLFLHPALLLIDHVHFQYNGFLLGVLVASIAMVSERRYLLGGALFAVALNLKHINLYIAPVYFVFLLRAYCFGAEVDDQRGSPVAKVSQSSWLQRFITLGSIVIAIFALSFGPFLQQLPQVFSRLFPFGRGLCHAYWAPNAWALYNIADKILCKVFKVSSSLQANMTSGLVGEQAMHLVLPQITPRVTMAVSLLAWLPGLVILWRKPSFATFVDTLLYVSLTSFQFGWHVHEKAILMSLLPIGLAALSGPQRGRLFVLLGAIGHISLFPLLFRWQEYPLNLFSFLCFHPIVYYVLKQHHGLSWKMTSLDWLLLLGVLPSMEFFCSVIHPILLAVRYPFLGLMVRSVACAIGVLYVWFLALRNVIWPEPIPPEKKYA